MQGCRLRHAAQLEKDPPSRHGASVGPMICEQLWETDRDLTVKLIPLGKIHTRKVHLLDRRLFDGERSIVSCDEGDSRGSDRTEIRKIS